jgi:cytochrome c biogenesis protein CcmG, thiol:disulfide interchange protein DsbE
VLASRLKLAGQAFALLTIALLVGLLGWKLLVEEGSGIRAALERGESPPAPGFTLPRLGEDGELSLEELRGQAVVVNFWASWCAPCRDEAPTLEAAWQTYRSEGLVVVGVDFNDFERDAIAFARENGMTYPLVYDRDGKLVEAYGATGVPETFVVDRQGRIVGRPITGAINARPELEAEFERQIRRALDS